MTAAVKRRRVAALATIGLVACWLVGPAGSAAADTDVTRVGGQGRDSACVDEKAGPKDQGDDGRAPLALARFHRSSFAYTRSLAVDGGGQGIFVPDRSVIRGVNGWVAGVPPRDPPSSSTTSSTFYNEAALGLTGQAAEGADAKTVRLFPLAVAVDPRGEHLYVLEPNAVRQVNLRETVPTIRTVAGRIAGTSLSVAPTSVLAADNRGNVYIGDAADTGTIHRLNAETKALSQVTNLKGGVGSLSVDAGGQALYAAEAGGSVVRRIDLVNGSQTVVAGGGTASQDGVSATSVRLIVEALAVHPLGGHLFISDDVTHRIRMVDLATQTIHSVVGSGQEAYQDGGKTTTFAFDDPFALAVDLDGNVFMLLANDCSIFRAVKPVVIPLPLPPTNPPAPQPPPTAPGGPTGQESNNPGGQSAPERAGDVAAAPQGNTPADQGQVLPGERAASAPPPQNELRIIEGNVVAAPDQGGQQATAPGPVAQVTPAAPTPTPSAAVDSGSVVVADPGPSSAVAADSGSALPPAPAAAPVPPAPASAPPPAAQEPVSNVGLAHGDSGSPARGATRYAIVRNDDGESMAALAAAGAGGLLAVFLCVLVAAPGASPKPKPRPRRAY